ncbi:MAG: SigB/SigF/SigG family RNA polymerase sigma factor [Nocardioides sp.]
MSVSPVDSSVTASSVPDHVPAGAAAGAGVREDRTAVTNRLLAEAAATADPVERKRLHDEVVVLNAGIAHAIAGRYRNRGVASDDLTQIAFLGMWKAVQRFDPSFERDFLSYAVPTIKGEIKRYFRDNGWSVRPPRRIQELQGRMSAALEQLTQDLGRTPRPGEVAQFLEIPLEDVVEALSADGCFTPTSLDTPVGSEDTGTLGELISGETEDLSAAEARVMLAPAVRSLSDRDRRILYLRFFKQWTQEQIASDIGVTQMQVSRLLARILRDLRGQLG